MIVIWVREIRKTGDGELSGMNDFMKDEVRKHLFWAKPEGWLPYTSWKWRSIAMIIIFDFIILCVASYRQRTG